MSERGNPGTARAIHASAPAHDVHPHDTRELRGMLPVLDRLGFDLDALLASAGLGRDGGASDAYIAPAACVSVFTRAHQERRVSNLALQLAVHTPVGATPLLDYLIVSADSVGHGLDRLVRYLRLVNPGIRIAIRAEGDPVRVEIERSSGWFENELTVSLSVLRFRRETDEQLQRVAGG